MRKWIKLISSCVLLCMLLSFAGCDFTKQSKEQVLPNEFPDIEFTYDLLDADQTIQFDGKPVSLIFELNNIGAAAQYGILVFIDGIVQEFKTEDYKKMDYMHNYELKAEENKSIQISLIPQNLEKGEYDLSVLVLLNPDFMPQEPNYVFGYNHKISYAYTKINVQADTTKDAKTLNIEDTNKISEVEKNSYVDLENEVDRLENNAYCLVLNDGKEEHRKIILDKKDLQIDFKLLGGNDAKYRITVFLNNEPILLEKEYSDALLHSSTEDYSILKLNLQNKQLRKQNVLYAVAVPTEEIEETAFPIKSDSIVVVR